MRRTAGLRAASLAVLILGLFAIPLQADSGIAAGSPGYLIEGRATGPEGRGIAGAQVELRPILSSYEAGLREAEGAGEPPPEAATMSGDDGRFALTAPRPGMWAVTVRAAGSVPVRRPLLPLLEPASLPDAVLASDAGLRVRIEDAEGRPVPGARVVGEEMDRIWLSLDHWAPLPRQALTGEDGEARLARVEGEALRVWAVAEGFAVAASPASRGPALTLRLRRAEPRRLVVREADGSAPPGLVVRDPASGLVLGRIPPGRMRARVAPGVTAVRLETADGRRVPLRLPELDPAQPAARIHLPSPSLRSAPVVDRGRQPIAGAWVWPLAEPGLAVRSDALGIYRLETSTVQEGLLLGAASGFMINVAKVPGSGSPALPILPTVVLDPAISLSGVVVDAAGRPQPEARIETVGLVNADQEEPLLGKAAVEGTFRVSGLTAGKSYRVTAYHPGSAPGMIALGPLAASVAGLRVVLRRGAKVMGSLVDERGGPVAGVEVELLRDTGQSLGRTATDAEGRFAIRDLPPGRGELILRRPGAAAVHRPGIEIPEGRTADLGSLLISGGATLAGRITDPDGRPLAGVEIQVQSGGEVPFLSRQALSGQTEADGTFSIPGLEPEREILLRFCHEKSIFESLELPAVPPEPLALTLRPAAHLAGVVVDMEGSPVPYASLSTRRLGLSPERLHADMPCISSSPSLGADAEGRFSLEPFAPGWYSLEARAPGLGTGKLAAVEVPAAGRDDLRIVLEPAPAESPRGNREEPAAEARERHEVRGRVVSSDGGPVAGASVASDGVLTGTAADGSFLLALTDGRRQLLVQTEDYSPAWQEAMVEVAGAPVDGVEIRLEATAELRGRISGLEPAELAWARVWAERTVSPDIYPAQVAADGSYRITRLKPGEWTVAVQAGDRNASQTFVLEPGEREAAVDLELAAVSAVSGWVSGPRGEPMPGAKVAFWNDDYTVTVTARSDGSFALRLPEGSYTFNAYGGGYHLDGPDGTLEVTGVPVGGLEMRLVRGTEVHGRVVGLAALALGEVPWIQAEGPALVYAELEVDGTFRLLDLDPGVWTVTAKLETEAGKTREIKRQVTVREDDGDIDLTIDLATDPALDPQD